MDAIGKALEDFASKYSMKGYRREFDYSKRSGNYRLVLSKGDKSIVIRDGCRDEGLSDEPRTLTSFDSLFVLEDKTFLEYVSDYPLEEYMDRLTEVFEMIDAFFEGNYTVSPERYMIFWKKNYLNIKLGSREEHLIQTK